MKSVSPVSVAGDAASLLHARAAGKNTEPEALFSDFQWFLYRARNTVHFTAFSTERLDLERVRELVGDIVALAPQLTTGFVGAQPGEPLAAHLVDAIISVESVDDFSGYPDRWLAPGLDIFATPKLPLFRVMAVVRRAGPDDEGRAAMIMVRASHALLEGADSALLTRSQSAAHGLIAKPARRSSLLRRVFTAAIAWCAVPLHLLAAHLWAPKAKTMGFASLALPRQQIRDAARRVGVRSRSLMFALVTHALNGDDRLIDRRVIAAAYSFLDGRRTAEDDDFFRLKALDARLPVKTDFAAFARAVDAVIGKVERGDTTRMQAVINAMCRAHRRVAKLFPALYGPLTFLYSGPFDLVLTLVPPHRATGGLTASLIEPIWCGSYHPGSNLCAFVPGREFVTFNFSMETKYLTRVGRIPALLAAFAAPATKRPRTLTDLRHGGPGVGGLTTGRRR